MDFSNTRPQWRTLTLLSLGLALLLVALLALSLMQNASLLQALLAGLGLVLLLFQFLGMRKLINQQRGRLDELQHSLITQRVTDPDTGAALPEWFGRALTTECRRAVREFTPLTLMRFDLKCPDPVTLAACRVRLALMLTDEVSRPGDLVGLNERGEIELLLPSTNEQAERLAERCVANAVRLLGRENTEVRLVGCTLQPSADLSPERVRGQLLRLLDEVRTQPPGSYVYRAESVELDAFSSTFSS